MEKLKNNIDNELLIQRKNPRSSDIRGPYYRDTTAIIHSSSFSRLKHKTQVFFAPENDHICTRMEHVLHVASIASAIARPLALDSELTWAIGIGHDLGHSPFGHVGERIINDIAKKNNLSGFQHELNSLRVVKFLSENGKGLNLTYAVQDGIATHCGEKFTQNIMPTFKIKDLKALEKKGEDPTTYEAAIVRFSDSIAYLGRDFEDAKRLGLLDDIPLDKEVVNILGSTNGEIINSLVLNLINNSNSITGIGFSKEVYEAVVMMKNYNYKYIYSSDILNGYTKYFSRLLNLIYDYLSEILLNFGSDKKKYEDEKNMLSASFYAFYCNMKDEYINYDGNLGRIILDYIAGMSDNFALDAGNEILRPDHLNDKIEKSLLGRWLGLK